MTRSETVPFIVGMQRSGNTLLRVMLDSHRDLTVPDESPFRLTMCLNRDRYERDGVFDVDRFIGDLAQEESFIRWRLEIDDVREALLERPPSSTPYAIREVFLCYARQQGKSRYADKTPTGVGKIAYLAEVFPWSRFVHIIRDGRDVALSQTNITGGIRTVGLSAAYWKRNIERAQRDGRRLGPDRYREFRYEDLIEDPETTLRSICEFSDLEFDEAMLRYYERVPDIYGTNEPPPIHKTVFLPPTKGLRDWRTQMDRRDIVLFEAIAGDVLDRLGYERVTDSVDPKTRLKATAVQKYVNAKERSGPVRKLIRRIKRRPHSSSRS